MLGTVATLWSKQTQAVASQPFEQQMKERRGETERKRENTLKRETL